MLQLFEINERIYIDILKYGSPGIECTMIINK